MTPTTSSTPTATNTPTASLTPTLTFTPTATFTASPTATPGLPACYLGTPNGLLPSDDTLIKGDSPSTNYGTDPQLEVRPDNGADRRGLLKFDLNSIPPNATITSATLYLYEAANKDGQVTYIYRVTSDWDEDNVTWQSWTSPGGDFDSSTSYFTFIPNQKDCMLTINVTGLVQQWVNGTYPNHGMMLYATGPNHTISYVTKEDTTASERPRLDIIYVVPTP